MKGIKRIQEAIEAGESMTTEDIVLSFLEECALRDIETWDTLQRFIPRLKAILAEQEKARTGSDPAHAKGMPDMEHTNK